MEMLKVHFGCFEMSAERWRLGRRPDPSPHPTLHLSLRSGGGNLPASCAKACAEAERSGGRGRGARARGVTLLPGSREALQPRGEFLRGEGVSASPPPPGLPKRAVPWELVDRGKCAVGGGGMGARAAQRSGWGEPPPPSRARSTRPAPADLCPPPTRGATPPGVGSGGAGVFLIIPAR